MSVVTGMGAVGTTLPGATCWRRREGGRGGERNIEREKNEKGGGEMSGVNILLCTVFNSRSIHTGHNALCNLANVQDGQIGIYTYIGQTVHVCRANVH